MAKLSIPGHRQRGASRTPVEKQPLASMFGLPVIVGKPQWWRRYRWWVLSLLTVVVLASMVSAELMAMSTDDSGRMFPLSRVEVTGDLYRLDHQQMRQQLLPATTGGFFDVDVLRLRNLVEQIPWVKDVQISRRWPDQLVIDISERQPLARWGDGHLLDQSGIAFSVDQLDEFAGLPALFGPAGSEQDVASGLKYLRQALIELPGGITKIEVNSRGVWQVSGADGIVIVFSGDPQHAPLEQLIRVYRQQLTSHWNKVVSVDLRYSDGIAVAFAPNTIKVEQGTRR
ncbi:MAG: FtsQ-type POTRA domain-containing protein [Immundisolibacteraceae bacterium]|nr:FtsQ-type POTRA domain-containing protein [Immundisolibacteraceae bacterium]